MPRPGRVRRATALPPRRLSLVLLALMVATLAATPARAAPRLGGHGADLSETSVSGVSSGGYMAVQFHVAHSRLVKGYPQTISRSVWWPGAGFVFNPQGCWDWWGYTGPDYHTKSGRQIQAVRRMLERLAPPR